MCVSEFFELAPRIPPDAKRKNPQFMVMCLFCFAFYLLFGMNMVFVCLVSNLFHFPCGTFCDTFFHSDVLLFIFSPFLLFGSVFSSFFFQHESYHAGFRFVCLCECKKFIEQMRFVAFVHSFVRSCTMYANFPRV